MNMFERASGIIMLSVFFTSAHAADGTSISLSGTVPVSQVQGIQTPGIQIQSSQLTQYYGTDRYLVSQTRESSLARANLQAANVPTRHLIAADPLSQELNAETHLVPASLTTRSDMHESAKGPIADGVEMSTAEPSVPVPQLGNMSQLDTLLLMLALAGLIVQQLRRKQKILPQRPIGSFSADQA